MRKKVRICIILILAIFIGLLSFLFLKNDKEELKSIKSEKQLLRIYNGNTTELKEKVINILCMPFSFWEGNFYGWRYNGVLSRGGVSTDSAEWSTNSGSTLKSLGVADIASSIDSAGTESVSSDKDYSTTNIQVENVDEADITKTDGDYIYSISENNVIITDVRQPNNISIASKINASDGSIPEDLILYKNTLTVISTTNTNNSSSYYWNRYNQSNTVVKIYDITQRTNPILMKNYELYESYYTSRCINNMLYVISCGSLREEDDKIMRNYAENDVQREIELENIKYMKDVETRMQTLISVVDLNNLRKDIEVSSYLMDISNAYVSENSIYLLDQKYEYGYDDFSLMKLYGLKGIIGYYLDEYEYHDYNSGYKTEIYKFDIEKDGNVTYRVKSKVDGETINQYSLDEKDGHLRVALYDSDGTRIIILDEDLEIIGISDDVAKGETMYSSRFMGDKVYLVTYKTMDPLFVIDLSDETEPTVLGELKIPGYSTYLHPYDENHLIGIGMETEEVVNRNSSGKVINTTDRIIGMKMALFDVSNVNNPIQISQTVIGDRRTTSAILTNPKALLFSRERELIAIPVNNYSEDFAIEENSNTYSSIISSYTNYNKNYVAEGYFVYKINLKDGFNLKGIITHEKSTKDKYNYYGYYYNNSKLLRGLYIDENLYTVSEDAVKVNKLDTLELVNELKIKKED